MVELNKKVYIISWCLLGENCKYNGGNNRNEDVIEFCRTHEYVSVCPECAGGLKAPREPAERVNGRIVNRVGEDLTEAFIRGAEESYREALEFVQSKGAEIAGAILKANSPSCGSGVIYDGTFTGTFTEGDGVFAALLKSHGIPVYSEKTIKDVI